MGNVEGKGEAASDIGCFNFFFFKLIRRRFQGAGREPALTKTGPVHPVRRLTTGSAGFSTGFLQRGFVHGPDRLHDRFSVNRVEPAGPVRSGFQNIGRNI